MRTATEILVDIENRLDIIEKRDQNIEHLLKLLLSKANKTPEQKNTTVVESSVAVQNINQDVINKDNFESRPKTNMFEKLAAEHGIVIDDSIKTAAPIPLNDEGMSEQPIRGAVRGQRGTKSNNAKKASVSQYLQKEDGSAITIANVEVLDQNGEIVNKTRTNPKGRWLLSLAPGDYQVHVQKQFPTDTGREPIDTTYQITVPLSDSPLELDSLTIK